MLWCALRRYEAYELERVQLREGSLKHKTEVDTLVAEHQAEVEALRSRYDSQVSSLQRQAAELQQRLEDTEGRLAAAQVRSSRVLHAAHGSGRKQRQHAVFRKRRQHAVNGFDPGGAGRRFAEHLAVAVTAAAAWQQVTIQEGRFVILSQQRAEQAIAAHAVQVTTDLGDTAAELADVFSKLKASLQVTSGDRDALKVGQ